MRDAIAARNMMRPAAVGLLSVWCSTASAASGMRADGATRSYAVSAALVDATLIAGGVFATLAWPSGHDGNRSGAPNLGPAVLGLGWMAGGSITHSLYGNAAARGPSVALRAKGLGLGLAAGAGGGALLGGGLGLVCSAAAGGYCPLAVVYGVVVGTAVGGTTGMGWAMAQDYRRYARRPAGRNASAALQPSVHVGVDGALSVGVTAAF